MSSWSLGEFWSNSNPLTPGISVTFMEKMKSEILYFLTEFLHTLTMKQTGALVQMST